LYPDDHITLAVQPHIVNLVEHCPYVDRILSVSSLLSWKKEESGYLFRFYLYRRARKYIERIYNLLFQQYDMVIYPVRSPQPNHMEFIYYLSVKKVVGMTGCPNKQYVNSPPHLNPYHLFTDYLDMAKIDPWQHEFISTIQFLRFLGCELRGIEDIQPKVWVTDTDMLFASEQLGLLAGPIIGLFPGASTEKKIWNIANYGPLAKGINREATFVIFGGQGEVSLANEVKVKLAEFISPDRIINLAEKTTLRQLFCCISLCNLLISMDTAGLHLAITAKIPTIGIVGGGHFGRFVPWGDPGKNIVLTHMLDCFHCNWGCEHYDISCINNIEVKEVIIIVNSMLA